MTAFITPTAFSVSRAQDFLARANSGSYYLFAGDHRPNPNTTLPDLSEAVSNVVSSPWQQMIMGKQVTRAALGIPSSPYSFGTAYQPYDDQADLTRGLPWYAVVNAGAFSHVFVCLENGSGANSTVIPSFSQATASNTFAYSTSDGYQWMYLASTDASTIANLSMSSLFPLVANATVSAGAVEGSIAVVSVQDGGKGYSNYLSGILQPQDITVSGVRTVYQMTNSIIHSVNGYYTGCVMLITGGTGVGQYATINDFFCTANGNFANLSSSFLITPTNGSTFQVMPGVVVSSDGTQTQNVVAFAQVNALASNSVSRVQVMVPGAGYVDALSTAVIANAVVGQTSNAVVRAIVPPRGGHGFDQATELGATSVLVGCSLSNTEGGLVPATNGYRQIGLLRNPSFANVQLTLSGVIGSWSQGEAAVVMSLMWAANGVTTNSASVVVAADTRMFSAGSPVYAQTASAQFLGTVSTVTNSTSMNLTSNSALTSNAVTLYVPTFVSNVNVSNPVSGSNVFVTSVEFAVNTGLTVFGTSSGLAGTITGITRNGVAKGFGTFVQLWKYAVTTLGGSFVQNEVVFQGNNRALVHSFANNVLYVSNMTGAFTVAGTNLTGNSSGAVAQVVTAYGPEVINRSATIEYLENLTPLTRGPTQTESFVVPFLF